MHVPLRFVAALLFVVVGLLALCAAGLLDWIVGVLFLSMEFLGEFLRHLFFRHREHRHPSSRPRHSPVAPTLSAGRHHRAVGWKGRPRRRRARHPADEPATTPSLEPRLRFLVPVDGDEPDFLDFALEECRARRAEMILLFLRPIAFTPMGPNPMPGLSEDDEALSLFERIGQEASRVGVPLRTLYSTNGNRSAAIGEAACSCKADVVVVGSHRRGRIPGFWSRDLTSSLLRLLPERACLTIHAS